MKVQQLLERRFEFKDADWPDAEGRFVNASAEQIANWLWRTRVKNGKKQIKAMYGATVNFVNANGINQKYAGKMQKVRDIIAKKAEKLNESLFEEQTAEYRRKSELYQRWRKLINMSPSAIESFKKSQLKQAKDDPKKYPGLKPTEASKLGISSGVQSADWIIKMKKTPVKNWTPEMWKWAGKQVSFVSRMSGNPGPLYDKDGNPTRKLLSLKIWGHNPR